MKKLVLAILILCLSAFCNMTQAREFYPKRMEAASSWGIGVYSAPKEINIYKMPDENSKLLENIKWNELGVNAIDSDLSSQDVFISFIPSKNIVLMDAVDEVDDWCEVIYNRSKGLKGWVKENDPYKFDTWHNFINTYGRQNGLYVFHDIPEEYQKLRTNPKEDAPFLKDFLYIPDNIKLVVIRGNWMLVKLLNFDNSISIGWTKWRDDEGKLYAFPNFDEN